LSLSRHVHKKFSLVDVGAPYGFFDEQIDFVITIDGSLEPIMTRYYLKEASFEDLQNHHRSVI
jgi:hypothetical protein